MSKNRKSVASVTIDTNVRCKRIYPVENSKIDKLSDMKTIGIKLTSEQAIQLARALLAASQDWKEIDITGFRFDCRKSDDTYPLTITSDKY